MWKIRGGVEFWWHPFFNLSSRKDIVWWYISNQLLMTQTTDISQNIVAHDIWLAHFSPVFTTPPKPR
jgi:hypothetical protein